jgi:hypothetical protein
VELIRRSGLFVLTACALMAGDVTAQAGSEHEDAYFRAVAEFFRLPAPEIAILRDWGIPADEVPVVLFVANRAGVSPEALVALRESGQRWESLVVRYRVSAEVLHLPVPDGDSAGRLQALYERYRSTPLSQWSALALSDGEVIALVNVRLLSQALGVTPSEILQKAGSSTSFVVLFGQLIR